jgi:hypothetical protein
LLNEHEVRYLVVGGYAVAAHGYPRYTKDLDVWVWIDRTNAGKLSRALHEFGFSSLAPEDFLTPGEFVQLGYPPNRIDIITSCEGLEFEPCYSQKMSVELGDITVNFIDYESLLINKRAVGRPQDLGDIDNLLKKKE